MRGTAAGGGAGGRSGGAERVSHGSSSARPLNLTQKERFFPYSRYIFAQDGRRLAPPNSSWTAGISSKHDPSVLTSHPDPLSTPKTHTPIPIRPETR